MESFHGVYNVLFQMKMASKNAVFLHFILTLPRQHLKIISNFLIDIVGPIFHILIIISSLKTFDATFN
jgi:hypothetical protein